MLDAARTSDLTAKHDAPCTLWTTMTRPRHGWLDLLLLYEGQAQYPSVLATIAGSINPIDLDVTALVQPHDTGTSALCGWYDTSPKEGWVLQFDADEIAFRGYRTSLDRWTEYCGALPARYVPTYEGPLGDPFWMRFTYDGASGAWATYTADAAFDEFGVIDADTVPSLSLLSSGIDTGALGDGWLDQASHDTFWIGRSGASDNACYGRMYRLIINDLVDVDFTEADPAVASVTDSYGNVWRLDDGATFFGPLGGSASGTAIVQTVAGTVAKQVATGAIVEQSGSELLVAQTATGSISAQTTTGGIV